MDLKWQKSSFSNPTGNSVEVARLENGQLGIRESDTPEASITTTTEKFGLFIQGVKAGEFDHLV